MNNHGTFTPIFNAHPQPHPSQQKQDPIPIHIPPKNLIHNNLKSILLNEEIVEYCVMIDSKDRNYQVYPDPFRYDVIFKPGKQDPYPTINDNFINVRYIRLDSVILPFYTKIREEDSDDIDCLKINPNEKLTNDMYVVLSLGNYTNTNYRSTNDVLSSSFATIYYDKKVSDTHYMGSCKNSTKIFYPDQLATINKFQISFSDPYGNPIRCDHLDQTIKSGLECDCVDPDGDDFTSCFKHNICHPLNPIFQHHLNFKIGVMEPRLFFRP